MNARQACLNALLEWEKGRSFSDEILHKSFDAGRFSPMDRAFLMENFFGVLRNISALDFLIATLREGHLDHQTRALLRMGLYQIFHMRIPAHAAVNETVALGGRARNLVNALMRRALREQSALQAKLDAAPLEIQCSHPDFLITRWQQTYGPDATRELLRWNNEPAEVHVRVNSLKTTTAKLLESIPGSEVSPAHLKALKVKQLPFDCITGGLCYVQDPSTLLACDLLDPQPGQNVLDACAAPGGKTTYLADLMQNQGHIVACDLFESRVNRLRENLQRLGVEIAKTMQHDCMLETDSLPAASFDRILVDAPCSNTGVIRRRVDVRWRLTEEDFIRMPAQQLALLKRTATLLKPGGSLVYSTCSVEPEENDQLVEMALKQIPGLQLVETRRTLPFKDRVDGAFAAKFSIG